MKQTDVEKTSRFEERPKLFFYNCGAGPEGPARTAANGDVRWFEFSGDATPVTGTLDALKPEGVTTRLDRSVNTILNSLAGGEEARALVLLTDGHDLEMVNPAKTGATARSRQTPIYAVPFGSQGRVRAIRN